VISNDAAENFRILEAPLDNTSKDAWTEVLAHRDDVLIRNLEVFKDFLVVEVYENGITQIEIIERGTGDTYRIEFAEDVYIAYSDDNHEFDTTWYRYTYESMTTPETTYDFNMTSKEHRLIKERPVLGGFDRTNYQSERLFATARDGTQIPVSALSVWLWFVWLERRTGVQCRLAQLARPRFRFCDRAYSRRL
jgi:oligopeptidase B